MHTPPRESVRWTASGLEKRGSACKGLIICFGWVGKYVPGPVDTNSFHWTRVSGKRQQCKRL